MAEEQTTEKKVELTRTIQMPEEFENRKYIIKKKRIPRRIYEMAPVEGEVSLEMIDTLAKEWVVDPILTDEYLNSDDCIIEEMLLLSMEIMDYNSFSKKRFDTLQKKVKKL